LKVPDDVLSFIYIDTPTEVVVIADPAQKSANIELSLLGRHFLPALDVLVVNTEATCLGELLADVANVTLRVGHLLPIIHRKSVLLDGGW
jgi:hypothetical protein